VIPRKPVLLFVFFILALSLSASEINDGYLRLILNEGTGSFTLSFLFDQESSRYESLFNSTVPSASFLAVSVDGRVYRLGESRIFRAGYERVDGNPALVYESPALKISEIFSPVKTANSPVINGVKITIKIESKNNQRSSVGLRMLIDTHLGEGRGKIPFITSSRIITNETLIEGMSGEKFWLSRGERTALMGSILSPDNDSRPPDFIHIANWKRLNDVPWRLRYFEGRSFNNIPYSIGDSAVCYYYNPAVLENRGSLTYTIFLTTEDIAWYNSAILPEPEPEAVKETQIEEIPDVVEVPTINFIALEEAAQEEAEMYNEDVNTITLLKLQAILEQFLAGEIILNEQDLTEIEASINRLRNRN